MARPEPGDPPLDRRYALPPPPPAPRLSRRQARQLLPLLLRSQLRLWRVRSHGRSYLLLRLSGDSRRPKLLQQLRLKLGHGTLLGSEQSVLLLRGGRAIHRLLALLAPHYFREWATSAGRRRLKEAAARPKYPSNRRSGVFDPEKRRELRQLVATELAPLARR